MTITIVTGAPGAGKTTYLVSKVIRPLVGQTMQLEDGSKVERRIVQAGIRGLLLDHFRLPHRLTGETVNSSDVEFWNQMHPELEDTPKFQRLPGHAAVSAVPKAGTVRPVPTWEADAEADARSRKDEWIDVVPMVQNWWLWVQPGDTLVIDEVQFLAPRGSLGKRAPYWIEALAIHRHYGIDVVLSTQHPQLIDTFIRNLTGQHHHIRPIFGSPFCMVFTWDHASNPERTKLGNKAMWRRGQKDYRHFHSATAHLKPPAAGRRMFYGVLALIPFWFYSYTGFFDRFKPEAQAAAPAAAASAPTSVARSAPFPLHGPSRPASGPSAPVYQSDPSRIAGCFATASSCDCMREDGARFRLAPGACADLSTIVRWRPQSGPLPDTPAYGAAAMAGRIPS
jgi:hypothetical protein